MYTYQVRLVNSRCLYKITLKVEPIDLEYLQSWPTVVNSGCLQGTTLKLNAIVRIHIPSPIS